MYGASNVCKSYKEKEHISKLDRRNWIWLANNNTGVDVRMHDKSQERSEKGYNSCKLHRTSHTVIISKVKEQWKMKKKQIKLKQKRPNLSWESRYIKWSSTHTLASSRPSSLTGVPDLGETKQLSDNSSRPIIRPGHQDPLRRRTHTKPPTDVSIALDSTGLPISSNKKSPNINLSPPLLSYLSPENASSFGFVQI